MKSLITALVLFLGLTDQSESADKISNWTGPIKEKIQLKVPLVLIRGRKGFLSCAYIRVETCDYLKEACAIVGGIIMTHEELINAKVRQVSIEAEKLGVKSGMSGKEAMEFLR
jgi:uncharacterized protein YunC (DUF1805 family)